MGLSKCRFLRATVPLLLEDFVALLERREVGESDGFETVPQTVLERANKVVKQVAESEKYDLVLQDAVYVNPKHDITDKVIKALNAVK